MHEISVFYPGLTRHLADDSQSWCPNYQLLVQNMQLRPPYGSR
jgi:hypothetical protein